MVTKRKTPFRTMSIYPETKEVLDFLARGTGKPKAEILGVLTKNLMQLIATFDTRKFTLVYEFSMFPEPCIKIMAKGESTFVIGSERELAALRRKMFSDIKGAIEEAKKEEVKKE